MLIEFAICIPIFVILLFYAHDLVRLYRYQSQTEFVAQQTVNMIQNISQKREDKRITKKDLQAIFALSWLSVCPGGAANYSGLTWKNPYTFYTKVFYVKGQDDGKASVVWAYYYNPQQTLYSNIFSVNVGTDNPDYTCFAVRCKKNVNPSEIYSVLKINPNEEKILVETMIKRSEDNSETDYNGHKFSHKEALGFYLIIPKYLTGYNRLNFFNSVAIFAPKPGLFLLHRKISPLAGAFRINPKAADVFWFTILSRYEYLFLSSR